VAEAQLEAARFEVDGALSRRDAPESEGGLVELGGARRIGREQRKLAHAAHLSHGRVTRRDS
jgi:hypothetical protein